MANVDLDRVVPARLLFHTIQQKTAELGTDHPKRFARRLVSSAKQYVALKNGTRANGAVIPALRNIREMAPTVTQPLCLLLAVPQELRSTQAHDELCRTLESLSLVYGVTRERWNRFESSLPALTRSLRAAETDQDLRSVSDSIEAEHIQDRANEFWGALDDLRNVPDRTQRFLLASIALSIQEGCRASEYRALPDLMTLSVEHVMPQCSLNDADVEGQAWREAMAVESGREAERLVYRLGNLTLLASELNAMVGSKIFALKAKTYADQPLLMTRSLVTDLRQGRRTGRREFADTHDLYPFENWSTAAIQSRHEFMLRLIGQRWPLLPPPP